MTLIAFIGGADNVHCWRSQYALVPPSHFLYRSEPESQRNLQSCAIVGQVRRKGKERRLCHVV